MNENLKLAAKLFIDLGEKLAEILADNKISLNEAFGLIPTLTSAPGVLEKKAEIKAEWESRTPESLADLNAYIAAELTLDNKGLEAKIEKAFAAGVAILDLIDAFKKEETPEAPVV